tara:strand:- start:8038 stop:8490 length:453 start_codon:yes stop_codon:yes gene_type:complete
MATRSYTTRRQGIVNAIVEKLKKIDGTGYYHVDLGQNVHPRLKFWDEVEEFPGVHVNAGMETREYLTGGVKNRFLTIMLRCYVNEENAVDGLDALLEDVETVLEDNSGMTYKDKLGVTQSIQQITILSINTDEGVLEPMGVGELTLEVRY